MTKAGKDRVILEELSKEYDREFDIRKHTEGKASTIIAFSGIILTLLLAFIALYIDNINLEDKHLRIIKGLLFTIVVTIGGSLLLSILSAKLGKNYDTASVKGIFLTSDRHVNWPGIINWRDNEENLGVNDENLDLVKKYIDIYATAVQHNFEQREKKAKRLLYSQISLMIGIGSYSHIMS